MTLGNKLFTLIVLLSMWAGVGLYHVAQMTGWLNIIVPNVEAEWEAPRKSKK